MIDWLIQDSNGHFEAQALACPDLEAAAVQLVEWFVLHWQLEVDFHEVPTRLGVETQRQWSEQAITQTTPALFGFRHTVATNLVRQRDVVTVTDLLGHTSVNTTRRYTKASATELEEAVELLRYTE